MTVIKGLSRRLRRRERLKDHLFSHQPAPDGWAVDRGLHSASERHPCGTKGVRASAQVTNSAVDQIRCGRREGALRRGHQRDRPCQGGLDQGTEDQFAVAATIGSELECGSHGQAGFQQGFQRDDIGDLVGRLDHVARQPVDAFDQPPQRGLGPECREAQAFQLSPQQRFFATRKTVVGAAQQTHLILDERCVHQPGSGIEIAAKPEIDASANDQLIDPGLVLLADVNGNARKASENSFSTRGSTRTTNDGTLAMCTAPLRPLAILRSSSRALSKPATDASAFGRNAFPARVSVTRRVVRSKSCRPDAASSHLIAAVKLGCATFSAADALVKLPCRATLRNARRCRWEMSIWSSSVGYSLAPWTRGRQPCPSARSQI
jgi:hypothetical protein